MIPAAPASSDQEPNPADSYATTQRLLYQLEQREDVSRKTSTVLPLVTELYSLLTGEQADPEKLAAFCRGRATKYGEMNNPVADLRAERWKVIVEMVENSLSSKKPPKILQ